MRAMLRSTWARPWACLAVCLPAVLGGGACLFGAVHEIDGDGAGSCRAGAGCHDPSGVLVLVLTIAGFALFALAATTWVRAFTLVGRARRRPLPGDAG